MSIEITQGLEFLKTFLFNLPLVLGRFIAAISIPIPHVLPLSPPLALEGPGIFLELSKRSIFYNN